MDWINALSKYFDFEEIEDKKKVRYAVTRLKGHATIWWDELQIHRERRDKKIINPWDKMLYNIKSQFMPKDYQLNLLRQLPNLRQKAMTIKEYTEEILRLDIRFGHIEGGLERVARYINGLRYDIQDELSLLNLKTVEDAYQVTLKIEEKLLRKQNHRNRGKNMVRGIGVPNIGGRTSKDEAESSSSGSQSFQRGGFRGDRGRGRNREVRCYTCGEIGHMPWDCPRNKSTGHRNVNVIEAQEESK